MFRRFYYLGSLACVGFLLAGCESLILPDLNGGMLNPDIRFLRAGEVMNGVKCAMTEFMRERELQLFNERKKLAMERYSNPEPFLALYVSEYPKIYTAFERAERRAGYTQARYDGKQNPFSPYSLHVDKGGALGENTVEKERYCNYSGLTPKDLAPDELQHWERFERAGCTKERCPGRCVPNKKYCPAQLGIVLWDYSATDVYGRKSVEPPGVGFTSIGNCAPIPDYSRFALDYTQQASIDLQITGTNQGTAFYDTINAKGLGSLQAIIAPGNKITGAVFPKADFTGKGSTIFDISVQMPQTLFLAASSEESQGATKVQTLRKNTPSQAEDKVLSKTVVELNDALQVIADNSSTEAVSQKIAVIDDILKNKLNKVNALSPGNLTKDAGVAFGKIIITVHGLDESIKQNKYPQTGQQLSKLLDDLRSKFLPRRPSLLTEKERLPPQFSERLRGAAGPRPGAPSVQTPIGTAPGAQGSGGIRMQSTAANRGRDIFTQPELSIARSATPLNQFSSGCGVNGVMHLDDRTDLDYLALKDLLLKVVNQQNDQMTYKGGPEIALDTLTLTTSFEIVLDMSAGTFHVFRLFPMITPPQMGVRADHTHQLKITLHGQKKKADPNGPANLEKSCLERIEKGKKKGQDLDPADAAVYCRSAPGKLLEAIIEATQDSKSSASSSTSSASGQ